MNAFSAQGSRIIIVIVQVGWGHGHNIYIYIYIVGAKTHFDWSIHKKYNQTMEHVQNNELPFCLHL